jgi:hypothetical protein
MLLLNTHPDVRSFTDRRRQGTAKKIAAPDGKVVPGEILGTR